MKKWGGWGILLVVSLLSSMISPVTAQNLAEFEKKVTEFVLENGMKFIIVERHAAPVVSFFTIANVGSTNETKGITGLAHYFEHMAFKGTTTIGAKDLAGEIEALKKEDELFHRLRAEERKGRAADEKLLQTLRQEFEEAKKAARALVVNNEFAESIQKAGGVGLNAFTSADITAYISSLPSNKLEMWFSMESDRFLNPFLREFYTEKEVIMEERRMSIENSPMGKLFEEFLNAAFLAHPYGESLIGHMSDLIAMSRAKAEQFFQTHYGASNLVAVIVGDVDPKQCETLARTYFGRLPTKPKPEPIVTEEPPQKSVRRVTLTLPAQPYLLMGFHKPGMTDPSKPAFDVLNDLFSGGRSSRLFKKLVTDKKLAIRVGTSGDFPGSKYPNLFVFFVLPAQGHTVEECEAAVLEEVARLQKDGVTPEELEKAKIRARSSLVYSLSTNSSIAHNLGYYEVLTGNWREMFRIDLEKISAVTAAEVQELAKTYLRPESMTVGVIKTVAKPTTSSDPEGAGK
jgi:predicted Zn-dependent peptidase